MRALVVLAIVLAPIGAAARDRVTLDVLSGRPITADATGVAIVGGARWDRLVLPAFEVGAGIEVGTSTGVEALERIAIVPGFAFLTRIAGLELRLEERFGWQAVHGEITLDSVPLRGTETRSFHDETGIAVDSPLSSGVDVRARVGMTIDGVYPAGHSSVRIGPFVGVAAVVHI
jgi:hypothetical protein